MTLQNDDVFGLRSAHEAPWLPWWLSSKESACNVGEKGLIPGLGRSPGEENGNSLQYSYLEDSMDRGTWRAAVHWVPKSWTQPSDRAPMVTAEHVYKGISAAKDDHTVRTLFFNVLF